MIKPSGSSMKEAEAGRRKKELTRSLQEAAARISG